mgnify:CR=1 FL=1
MNLFVKFVPMVAVVLLTGCMYDRAQYDAQPYTRTATDIGSKPVAQQRVHAAAHWDALALEPVAGIEQARVKLPNKKTPFFVEAADPTMPFSVALRELLITRLTQAGLPVSLSRGGAYRIHTDVRPVPHKQYVPPPMSGYVMGGGIAGISAISIAAPTAPTIAAGAILYELADANGIFPSEPRPEVMVTVSVTKGAMIYHRWSKIFYTTSKELLQYVGAQAPAPLLVHEASAAKEPLKIRQFSVGSTN